LAGWKSEIATLRVIPNNSATATSNIIGSQTLTDLVRDNLDAEDRSDGFYGQTWLNINALTNLNACRCEPIHDRMMS
jgi:hypothetical protein